LITAAAIAAPASAQTKLNGHVYEIASPITRGAVGADEIKKRTNVNMRSGISASQLGNENQITKALGWAPWI